MGNELNVEYFYDELPSNDWLEKMYIKREDPHISSWHLGSSLFIDLYCNENGLRLHIRLYTPTAQMDYYPTKKGVVMNVTTWDEFTSKLSNFNFQYKGASFIANNQLAVFQHDEDFFVLQQIFKDVDTYTFKPISLMLLYNDVDKIPDYTKKVNDCILKTKIKIYLRQIMLKNEKPCTCDHHITSAEAKQNLFNVCYEHILHSIKDLYKCHGCIIDHPSQTRHECMTVNNAQKYYSVRESILIRLDMPKVWCTLLQSYCICNYVYDFFENLCMDELKQHIDNQFKL